MKDGISALGIIGVLIVTGIAIYNIWSGRTVNEVQWPGGSKITFGNPIPSPSQSKTPNPEVSTKPEETPNSRQEIITESPLPTPEPEVSTKSEDTPSSRQEIITESSSLDISGDWQLLDTNSKPLRLVIQQNEKNVEMKVYDYNFNGYNNTWIFQGIINGKKITGNSYHFTGLQGRGNLEVSSNRDKITGSFVYSNGLESPFLARR